MMEGVTQTTEYDSVRDDDSLYVASKYWERVMDAAVKTGYREGIQDGTDSVLQEGFDIGYKDGFESAFTLGRYKGLTTALALEHHTDVAAVLEKTRRGVCWICNMELLNKTSDPQENIPFSENLNEQRKHFTETINRLHEYFKPILKKSGIKINSTI